MVGTRRNTPPTGPVSVAGPAPGVAAAAARGSLKTKRPLWLHPSPFRTGSVTGSRCRTARDSPWAAPPGGRHWHGWGLGSGSPSRPGGARGPGSCCCPRPSPAASLRSDPVTCQWHHWQASAAAAALRRRPRLCPAPRAPRHRLPGCEPAAPPARPPKPGGPGRRGRRPRARVPSPRPGRNRAPPASHGVTVGVQRPSPSPLALAAGQLNRRGCCLGPKPERASG
jgi:hypothetical protein